MTGFWHKCRVTFRCLRFAAWAAVLAALLAFLWCNQIGVPDFVKNRLVATLAEHGVKLEFSRMRLSLVRGLVAENVRVGQPENSEGRANFSARQVQLELNFSALIHRRWQLDGVGLHDGKLVLPESATEALELTNLQTNLRFGADNTWSLDHFRAEFAGIQLGASGELAHAPEALGWKLFTGSGTTNAAQSQASLKIFSDALKQIRFAGRPQLRLSFSGDARDIHTVTVRLDAVAPEVGTPWFGAQNLRADATLTAPADAPAGADAAWGFWTNLQPFRLAWSVRADSLHSEKLDAGAARCDGEWAAPQLLVKTFSARLGEGKIEATAALDVPSRTVTFTNNTGIDPRIFIAWLPEKARAEVAKLVCPQLPVLNAGGLLVLPPWDSPAEIWPDAIASSLDLGGTLAGTNLEYRTAPVDLVRAKFSYSGQMLTVSEFTVAQGQTRLTLSGQESEMTKNFRCRLSGNFDAASVRPFLADSNAVSGFECLTFHEPLKLWVEAAGNLRTPETVCATGQIALANFAIRGQTIDRVTADLTYSNLTVDFLRPQLSRANGAQVFAADKLTFDIAGLRLFLTNGAGHVEPMVVGRAIGPQTSAAMTPYEFLAIPETRANGCIPLRHRPDGEILTDDADLRVDVVGTAPFRWKKFQTPAITGTILWRKNFLIVTNATTECYGGEAHGWGNFNVSPDVKGTPFSFWMAGTNVDLHCMGLALWSPTNELGGSLAAIINVTRANSDDWRTWNGGGMAHLRDGQLWNVPVFGVVSRGVNAVMPGLGNSRATSAAGGFLMTNGVIFTDTLVIHTPTMLVNYAGTVDLDENVNARATAQILRNTPMIGPFMSSVFWPVSKIFECRVTGKLEDPKVAPVYLVPKLLLAPLHPVRSLEDLFTPSKPD
jgi:hypothetical protein